jgi:hypothetical protein
MGHADCIGHNSGKSGYIFAMWFGGRLLMQVACVLALLAGWLRADPGDAEGSRDYPNFPRVSGFLISDYDEDNPADFDFPIARPTTGDSNNVQTIHVRGHRYIIRYELAGGGRVPTLYQTQQYYEQLAAAAGFTIEKTGAVGDVSETFRKMDGTHEIWVCLEPAVTSNVLTVVESNTVVPLTPAEATVQAATPSSAAPSSPSVVVSPAAPAPTVSVPTPTPPSAPQADTNDDSLYESLRQ